IIDRISWCFPLLGILNAIYANFSNMYSHTAFVLALLQVISSAMTHIIYVINESHSPTNLMDDLFVHLLFTLHHSWTTILVVLTAFEAFG
ncbi:hypothetical protein EDB84DRAFT_1256980, partial [Lactarius hengduanensis]